MTSDGPDKKRGWRDLVWKPHQYNDRKVIKSGSYLRSFCPHCNAEFSIGNVIRLEVTNPDDQIGMVELSPYLNVFECKTEIRLPQGKEVKDLRCSFCHESLVVPDNWCNLCNSHVASFLVGISNSRVPFFICLREGCHWHDISADDETQIMLDDSDEW
ncbi:MAG: hypothetical protein RBT76_15225 [candidate division Zixibacteria bacterium]|nr:hypothetical protein [candidate division Zixibacteria bacterium]